MSTQKDLSEQQLVEKATKNQLHQRAYYQKNKERILENRREYYQKNKERILLSQSRRYYEKKSSIHFFQMLAAIPKLSKLKDFKHDPDLVKLPNKDQA